MQWCVLVLLGLVNVGVCQNCRGEKPRLRDCDQVCDASGDCKIRAALLLPRNTRYDACLSAVGPVLDLAMEDPVIKKAFPSWLSVEWLKYDVTDCDAAYAVISAIDAYNDCAHVFFGPSCDYALASVGRIAKFLGGTGTPLVTTGGFTFDFVKPKQTCHDEFYMMVRAGPVGFEDLAYFIINLMKHFEWKQLLLITEPESQLHVAGKSTCHLMMKSFANFLKKEEILYTPWDTTSDAGLNYTENLKFYLGYKYTMIKIGKVYNSFLAIMALLYIFILYVTTLWLSYIVGFLLLSYIVQSIYASLDPAHWAMTDFCEDKGLYVTTLWLPYIVGFLLLSYIVRSIYASLDPAHWAMTDFCQDKASMVTMDASARGFAPVEFGLSSHPTGTGQKVSYVRLLVLSYLSTNFQPNRFSRS